jgi:protein-tyrosine phosphatase
MIDLHCHILPGIDDGARSLEESLSMARTAVKDGLHTIVATPHTLNGIYLNPAKRVTSLVAALQKILTENHIELRLFAGSEVHLCPQMVKRIKSGEAATINNGRKYILLELPVQTIPKGLKNEIFSLKLSGITPIIAHPERNTIIQHDPDILYELVSMGALSQVTAMSVTGGFGELARQSAEALLSHRLAHIIASDAHSADGRPPVLSYAVEDATEILGSHEEAERMVTEAPAAILSGNALEICEPSRVRKQDHFWK